MKKRIEVKIEEPRKGMLVLPLPAGAMKKLKLEPFMAADWEIKKKSVKLTFSKTVKMKIDISKKTLKLLKRIMMEEGHGSIDEVVSNAILEYLKKLGFKTKTDAITFLYPMDYFKKKYWLIEEYEKGRS